MQNHKDFISVSIVVPVYSGERYLSKLVTEISELISRWEKADVQIVVSEAIFVLDSPIDGSRAVLETLATSHSWVRLVDLSRNFGQHSATVAGILYSSGDWVVTLDEDLQHRPGEIETLLRAACKNQDDVVYAHPKDWVHGGGYRDRISRLVKSVISYLSGNPFVLSFNSFRLIRGDVARAAASICAQHTYFDVALTWFTQRIGRISIQMNDDRYVAGKKSGYRLATLIQHAKRLIMTSDFRVLRFTTFLSIVVFVTCIAYAGWVLFLRFFAGHPIEVEGWTSLMVVMLAFISLAVFMLGLIIEFVYLSMLQLQGKPAFFVVNRGSDHVLLREMSKLE